MRHGLSAIAILLTAAGALPAQDTAQDIIKRAAQAHGGLERLGRIRADRIQVKGNLFVDDKETPFTGETTVQFPAQFKNVMQITTPKGRVTLVQILNGDKAMVTLDGQPQKVEPTAIAELRDTFALNRAMRLAPLLTERTYELAALGESKVGERPALGVKVTAKGRRELMLYFDKETNLLVKTEHLLEGPEGKDTRQEVFYGDFRDLGGYKRPLKIAAYRDGKKVMEAEITDVKYFDHIDETEFAKP
jgi:hypothetical protein